MKLEKYIKKQIKKGVRKFNIPLDKQGLSRVKFEIE